METVQSVYPAQFLNLNGNPTTKLVTEERYYDMLGQVPPIYFSSFNFEKVQSGFMVSEIYDHTPHGLPVYMTYFKDDAGNHHETLACASDKGEFVRRPVEWSHYTDALWAGQLMPDQE